MFGDTHLDNDTAEVSLDDELMEDFDTTDDLDDEDIEVSYTGEEETPAEDTNPQDEQTAEQQDGEQHPEGIEACGIAQNFGAENVAVKLLQNKNEQHKIYALHGIDQ